MGMGRAVSATRPATTERPRLSDGSNEAGHILRRVPDRPADTAWLKLGAEPGLCGDCIHAKLNETRRGTAYVRCMRAAWDAALSRYPRLPVTQCTGFERLIATPALKPRP
jgi:hypothetical protein